MTTMIKLLLLSVLCILGEIAYANVGVRAGVLGLLDSRIEYEGFSNEKGINPSNGLSVSVFGYKDGKNIQISWGYLVDSYKVSSTKSVKDALTYFGVNYIYSISNSMFWEMGANFADGTVSNSNNFDPATSWSGLLVKTGPIWKVSQKVSFHANYMAMSSFTRYSYQAQKYSFELGIWF